MKKSAIIILKYVHPSCYLIILLLSLSSMSCRNMVLRTKNELDLKGPLETKVSANLSPRNDDGPLIAKEVASGNSTSSSETIAIVDLDGILLNNEYTGISSLGENPVALFRDKLDSLEKQPNIRAVILRINSPGGGVAACGLMRRDLLRFRQRTHLPVIACLLDNATGGAYYIASAADQMVAIPESVVGGIGVILNLYNLRDLMQQFNIVPQEIKAGPNIDMGSVVRKIPDETKKWLQGMADQYQQTMIRDIRAQRPKIPARDQTVFDGRIFTAEQALERGLIDRIADLDEIISDVRQYYHLSAAATVLYRRKNDPAYSIYAVSPNTPIQAALLPSVPGMDRSKLPVFLSMWQIDPTAQKQSGK